MKIDNKILNAPCIFCNNQSPRYWSALSHDPSCPFYRVSGKANRQRHFKNAVRKQSILLDGLRGGEMLIADPDDVI